MKLDKKKARETLELIESARRLLESAIVADFTADAVSDLDEVETYLKAALEGVEKLAETLYTEDGDLKP